MSHDKITRFLSQKDLDSKQLWKLVKPVVRKQEQDDGVLIVDDTIEKKQGHFARIDSLAWSSQKSVRGWLKGLNFPVQLHRQVFTNKSGVICEAASHMTPDFSPKGVGKRG